MKRFTPKRWKVRAALEYSVTHVSGKNQEANIPRDSNVEGAARLCAWALARYVWGEGGRERVQVAAAREVKFKRALDSVLARAILGFPGAWEIVPDAPR